MSRKEQRFGKNIHKKMTVIHRQRIYNKQIVEMREEVYLDNAKSVHRL
jgi:hypothetical protein